jgi:cytochrome c oxidase subunit 2
VLASALAGCEGVQSALSPVGPQADAINGLGLTMMIGGAAIFAVVALWAALALFGPPAMRRAIGSRPAILVGGIGLPAVLLSALLVQALILSGSYARPPAGGAALRVEIVAEQWWWRVNYLDAAGDVVAVSANEIRIPTGRPVEFILRSADVIHAFWVPALGGKLDMIPGRTNAVFLEAERPGIYRGQCTEFCGLQHARMAFYVLAEEEDDFVDWLSRERGAAARPVTDEEIAGAELFAGTGCGACHTVRGTEADGTIGPDLTHVGSRQSIAAGTLPNNQGTLAAWISDAQGLKPGTQMPSFGVFSGPELRAVAAYLASLQ